LFLVGRRRRLLLLLDLLLSSALRAEVDRFIGKLFAAVRTGFVGFFGQLRAALRAEVGCFVGKLRTAVRARQLLLLFLGMLLGQCALLPCSSGVTFPVGCIPIRAGAEAHLLSARRSALC
jgi:hypothetical protein